METSLTIPNPLDWQSAVLADDKRRCESLNAVCVGRRSGKSHLGLLWLTFAPGGLMEGKPVCWGAPTDAHLADIRAVFKQWFWPLIKGPSPGGLGFELENGSRLDFWSLSPGHNAFRGRGYSLAVIDESALERNLTTAIEQNLMPALAQYQGRLLLCSTPKGFNQFFEWFRRAEREGMVVQGASTLNPLVSEKWLAEERRKRAELVYQQEILAQFVTIEGGLLKRSEIRLGTPPERDRFLTLSMGLDFALTEKKSGDFSACVIAGVDEERRTWILHSERWRLSWPDTFQRVHAIFELWQPHIVLTESVAFSELCVRELAASGIPIDAIKPSVDKIARFSPVHARYRAGQIHHASSLDAEFEDELLAFPEAANDDQVDALTYAVTALDRTIRSAWSVAGAGAVWGTELPHEVISRRKMLEDRVREEELERSSRPRPELVRLENGRTFLEWRTPKIADEER
jgi:predicted phage terminase large subunit-like protein